MEKKSVGSLILLLSSSCAVTPAGADGLLGLYAGAGFGESHLRSEQYVLGNTDDRSLLEGHHGAWYVDAGFRPLKPLGVELEYIDFGRIHARSGSINGAGGIDAVEAKAGSASLLGYLPLPVPFLDIYGRVGVARLRETIDEIGPVPFCPIIIYPCGGEPSSISNRTTNLVYGAGVQGKVGPLIVRADYERVSASGENPSLASLGVAWKF